MPHYTIGYHDSQENLYEICEYAQDSYEAIQHAIEDVPELQAHPHAVYRCTNESGLDYVRRLGSLIDA